MLTCCVCNRSGSDVVEQKCTLSKEILPYCLDCLLSGREPYEKLVAFGWDFNMFSRSYRQKIILPTLAFSNKTVQQFNEDVEKKRDEKNA